jgi:hypothetical protein
MDFARNRHSVRSPLNDPRRCLECPAAADRDNIDFDPANTPDFHHRADETEYMNSLFTVGYDLGAHGHPWAKFPADCQSGTSTLPEKQGSTIVTTWMRKRQSFRRGAPPIDR